MNQDYQNGQNGQNSQSTQNDQNGQGNFNQNNYDSGSYQYSGSYNQSQNFTSEFKAHQHDGIIALITGIVSLFLFGLVGVVLSVISIVFGINARKFPQQKTYGTVGVVCGVISLIKIALAGFIAFSIAIPFFGELFKTLMYNI